MGFAGDALLWLTRFAQDTLAATGYLGLLLLMAAESMVFPVPSEAVMPFAGSLVQQGTFSWAGAILASSAGSVAGSWLSYLLGRHGFLPFVERYGKYLLVRAEHIERAQAFFARRGAVAIFLCRFIPIVRHVSSIPAGSARMPPRPFLLATLAGATLWNTFLLWVGYKFAGNAAAVGAFKRNLDLIGIGLLLLLAGYVFYEVRRGKQAKAE